MKRSGMALWLALVLAASGAQAGDELAQRLVTQGNDRGAAACASCHGANGEGMAAAGFPTLAGQNAAYLKKQLADYRSGRRDNPIMQPVAAALSDDEVAALAAYFARQTPPPAAAASLPPEREKKAHKLAVAGDWNRNLPACFACHGPNGAGIAPNFPVITGQNAPYIEAQLNAWKAGLRKNDPNALMKVVAERMSADEIRDLAAWLAAFKPAQ